jgi:hypothetical protein
VSYQAVDRFGTHFLLRVPRSGALYRGSNGGWRGGVFRSLFMVEALLLVFQHLVCATLHYV